jgi:hypothetical protein
VEAQRAGREADPMKRVCIVCEGQTEETFVRDVLAPAFYDLGLNLIPEMVEPLPPQRRRLEVRAG